MTPRTAWRGCAAAGIVAFICSWSFGRIPGMASCGPDGGVGPIIAFEFARTPADVAALFGSAPCTTTLAAAQKIGLLLDALGFIPSYTTFLILAAIAAGAQGPVRQVAIAIFLLAAASDEIEGALLYAILRDLPGTPLLLQALWWPVHVKFALLGLGTVQIGSLLGMKWSRPWPRRVAGSLIFTGGFFALLCLFLISQWAMIGFTIAWITLLIVALTASLWPSLFGAPAAPPQDPATHSV